MTEGAPKTAKAPSSEKQLAPYYRKWLEEEVTYIINEDEKRQFLSLHTDAERDGFIKTFWDIRNPNRGSETNEYRNEHYKRLDYANEHFGDARYQNGWKTDMGRVYITLGPPKQKDTRMSGRRVRPFQVWFYEGASPALPPYFNVAFYQESYGEDWKLYSPTQDGMKKLVTDDTGTEKDWYKTLIQGLGPEDAHIALTLLPDEPVNNEDPRPTLDSDVLLGKIRDLPDQPLEKARIASLRAATTEKVSSALIFGSGTAVLETATLRDAAGRETVHLLLNNGAPDTRLVGKLPDGRMGYHVRLVTRVRRTDGQALFQQEDEASGVIPAPAVSAAQARDFGFESRVPLVPGNYVLETLMVNELNHQGETLVKAVSVPDVAPGSLSMSSLIQYRQPAPQQVPEQFPFTMAQLRFAPRSVGSAEIAQGESLPLVFQVWMPKGTGTPIAKLQAHYVVGSVAAVVARPITEDEEIDASNVDAAGNLLTGHTIQTESLAPGSYRVVVSLLDPVSHKTATSSMSLHVLGPDENRGLWTAYGTDANHPLWREELLRGVAYEAAGDVRHAEAAYKSSLQMQPHDNGSQAKLDALEKKTAAAEPAKK